MDLLGDFETGAPQAPASSLLEVVDPREARHVLLKKIYAGHCLLDIRLGGDDAAYQSAIIELLPEAGYLVIDALTPTSGNQLAARLPSLRVRARLAGIEVKFSSRILQRGSQAGLAYYKVLYPQDIEYPQRRRESRVTVPLDRGVPVRFATRGGGWVRGEIRDLSARGFCARLLSGDVNKIDAELSQPTACEIDLPGQATLQATVELRHMVPSRARSAPRVGAHFVALDAHTENLIARCVVEFKRARLHSS